MGIIVVPRRNLLITDVRYKLCRAGCVPDGGRSYYWDPLTPSQHAGFRIHYSDIPNRLAIRYVDPDVPDVSQETLLAYAMSYETALQSLDARWQWEHLGIRPELGDFPVFVSRDRTDVYVDVVSANEFTPEPEPALTTLLRRLSYGYISGTMVLLDESTASTIFRKVYRDRYGEYVVIDRQRHRVEPYPGATQLYRFVEVSW